jgi:hypothetical protein
MFKWFTQPIYTKAVKLPAPVPYVEPPAPEVKDPVTYYSLGPTNNNRINFKIGYSSINMNKAGALALINLLTTAMNQLTDEDEE